LVLVAALVVMLVKLLVTLHRLHELPRYAQPPGIVYRA
jgi:hypothetical protein